MNRPLIVPLPQSGKPSEQPQSPLRPINSCDVCRRRKVKCDHGYPTCSACLRGDHQCSYRNARLAGPTQINSPASSSSRISKGGVGRKRQQNEQSEINARLGRLEELIERVAGGSLQQLEHNNKNEEAGSSSTDIVTEAVPIRPNHLRAAQLAEDSDREAITDDGYDGTLLLEGSKSHFVMSNHWALLADQIQDIKALIQNQADNEDNLSEAWTPSDKSPPQDSSLPLIFGRGERENDPVYFYPDLPEQCFFLLDTFFANVDPMLRLLHRPTFTARFNTFIERATPYTTSGTPLADTNADKDLIDLEPLVLSVLLAATKSLTAEQAMDHFSTDQTQLLEKFQEGTELSLQRANLLTTFSLEVLQAFVILLTCQCQDDNMGKVWSLSGLAIRIALSQGLHREPTLFSSKSMDAINVELRRRLWHQICHLDYRAAQALGQEPTISIDDFDTLLPTNIDDIDLHPNQNPSTVHHMEKFTDMTQHLVRLTGIQYMGRAAHACYRLERKMKALKEPNNQYPSKIYQHESQELFEQTRLLAFELHDRVERLYIRHCGSESMVQKLTRGLGELIEWGLWITFWTRCPRSCRENVISWEVRVMIFTKSIYLLESLIFACSEKITEPFQWHIRSHSSLQAVMYVLSEIRNPVFAIPETSELRQRGLRALKTFKDIRVKNATKIWFVIQRMIDSTARHYGSLDGGYSTTINVQGIQNQNHPIPEPTNHDEMKNENFTRYFPNVGIGQSLPSLNFVPSPDPVLNTSREFDFPTNGLSFVDLSEQWGIWDFDVSSETAPP